MGAKVNEYKELNRMWIDDKAGKNSESMAISYSIKYIRSKFRNVKWIQSFADERCGKNGIVYQAANFKYYGEHTSIFWELDGVFYHNIIMTHKNDNSNSAITLRNRANEAKKLSLRQFRYIYWIDRREMGKCKLKECEPPKHYK